MIEVRKEVLAATDGKQAPWDHCALTGDIYFHPTWPKSLPCPAADAEAMERRIKKTNSRRTLASYRRMRLESEDAGPDTDTGASTLARAVPRASEVSPPTRMFREHPPVAAGPARVHRPTAA